MLAASSERPVPPRPEPSATSLARGRGAAAGVVDADLRRVFDAVDGKVDVAFVAGRRHRYRYR